MRNVVCFVLCAAFVLPLYAQEEKPVEKIIVAKLIANQVLGWKNPSEYCLEDGYLYKGADYRIGTTNIHSDNPQDLKALSGKMVVVHGRRVKDLTKILVKAKKAPKDYGHEESMQQIRSDWVTEETGFEIGRSTHERLSRFSFIRYSKVEEFKGFNVEKGKLEVKVTFTNTFDKVLTNIVVYGHYETRRGKPRPSYTRNQIDVLQPKQSVTLNYYVSDGRKRLHSVGIRAKGEGIQVDVEQSTRW